MRIKGWKPGKWANINIPAPRVRAALLGERRGAHIYTTREVAVLLRHSMLWVQRMVREGRIRAVRLGGQYFINENEVMRLKGVKGRPRRGKEGAREVTKAPDDLQMP